MVVEELATWDASAGDWGDEASEGGDGKDSEEGSIKEFVDVDCLIVS